MPNYVRKQPVFTAVQNTDPNDPSAIEALGCTSQMTPENELSITNANDESYVVPLNGWVVKPISGPTVSWEVHSDTQFQAKFEEEV